MNDETGTPNDETKPVNDETEAANDETTRQPFQGKKGAGLPEGSPDLK
ncbi:hypothetical protein [Bhargavaea changchunensis]